MRNKSLDQSQDGQPQSRSASGGIEQRRASKDKVSFDVGFMDAILGASSLSEEEEGGVKERKGEEGVRNNSLGSIREGSLQSSSSSVGATQKCVEEKEVWLTY